MSATKGIVASVLIATFCCSAAWAQKPPQDVRVLNFPNSQTVNGTVSVGNFPGTVGVDVLSIPKTTINGERFVHKDAGCITSGGSNSCTELVSLEDYIGDSQPRSIVGVYGRVIAPLGTLCQLYLEIGIEGYIHITDLLNPASRGMSNTIMLPIPIALPGAQPSVVMHTHKVDGTGDCFGSVSVMFEY